ADVVPQDAVVPAAREEDAVPSVPRHDVALPGPGPAYRVGLPDEVHSPEGVTQGDGAAAVDADVVPQDLVPRRFDPHPVRIVPGDEGGVGGTGPPDDVVRGRRADQDARAVGPGEGPADIGPDDVADDAVAAVVEQGEGAAGRPGEHQSAHGAVPGGDAQQR